MQKQGPVLDKVLELAVELELAAPDRGFWRRPYVAVWIEDPAGKPVRTLAAWLMNSRKGWRWLRDLRRWHRANLYVPDDQATAFLDAVSSPTRNPGKYTLVWDLADDKKHPVPVGDYVVCVEAAREHGTYQLGKLPIKLDGKPFKAKMAPNVEVASATVELRRRK
jgi:hypothetical protein